MDVQNDTSGGAKDASKNRPQAAIEHIEDGGSSNEGDQKRDGDGENENGIAYDYKTEAVQVPLPSSNASSADSTHGPTEPPPSSVQSLENTDLRREKLPLPSRKKASPFLTWVAGTTSGKPKKVKKQEPTPALRSKADEVENYRENVKRLADHFPYFDHYWSSRIVIYDSLDDERHQCPRRIEPWPKRASPPPYLEFYRTLRTVADNCKQRVVLIEDLNPSLVDLLGATLDIPPHVFEEHLDRAGYQSKTEHRKNASAWNHRSSAQGYSSVTWYRPVLPLLSLDPSLRANLISKRSPRVPCPLEGCKPHQIALRTARNIWRHCIDLCPEPRDHQTGLEPKYPVGWEERATLWSRHFGDCKFGNCYQHSFYRKI
jgi:hypothetical protein